MTLEPLTREFLDEQMCDNPDCLEDHELYVEQACHLGAGKDVIYIKSRGVVRIECTVCHAAITEFLIAKGGEEPRTETYQV